MVTKFEKVVEWSCDIESIVFPLGAIFGLVISLLAILFDDIWFIFIMLLLQIVMMLMLGNIKRKVYWEKLSSKTEKTRK